MRIKLDHTILWAHDRDATAAYLEEVLGLAATPAGPFLALRLDNDVTLDVFVKKDDAEGTEFYHLGRATSRDAEQTTMTDGNGKLLDVVRMHLTFPTPIEPMLFDYFHPVTTA